MRLGFVTELLSKSIRYGDMNGIALAALISQLPKLFGFSVSVPRASIPPWAPPSTPTSKSTRWIGNHENSTISLSIIWL